MNKVELALEKQRLQMACDDQRTALASHLDGLAPLFDSADRIRAGARWIRQHPEIVGAGVAVVVAVRPGARRFAWRWGRRAFLAWRMWRNSERWLNAPIEANFKRH